ncbi:hypothetical protein CEQ28_013745 [Hafnia alvei]|nr:hypothetical protein CEQ28_013745 [Hafnia alvei]
MSNLLKDVGIGLAYVFLKLSCIVATCLVLAFLVKAKPWIAFVILVLLLIYIVKRPYNKPCIFGWF